MITPALLLLAALTTSETRAVTLAREMTQAPLRLGAGDSHSAAELLYAHAFAGYALAQDALRGNALDAEVTPVLDSIIERVAQPLMGRTFGCGWTTVAGHTVSKSVAHRGHLLLLLMARARLHPTV